MSGPGLGVFFSVFGVIFVAELPDKLLSPAIAVAAGQLVGLLPERPVHLLAGALFVVSVVVLWRRNVAAGLTARSNV